MNGNKNLKGFSMNFRRKIQNYFFNHISFTHDYYGKIFLPSYNMYVPFDDAVPELYNKNGERMKTVFIRDSQSSHSPYSNSQKVFFDRYNFGLDTHFYSQVDLLQRSGKPVHSYAMFSESEVVVPESYKTFEKNKGLEKEFEYIFTMSDKLLNELPNAKFVPFCTEPWFGTEKYGGVISSEAYKYKTKNISIMSSRQNISEYHKLRIAIAKKCKQFKLADTYGTFDGGAYLDKIDHVYAPYRYSIVIENDEKPFYFTEKITSCFASMTIPIYLGATRIGKFFNEDGIIKISSDNLDNLEDFLKQCNEQDYNSRLNAVKDNFDRVQKYLNVFDNFIYEPFMKGNT
jgi:hypothetical protein